MKKSKLIFFIKLSIFSVLIFFVLFQIIMPQYTTSYNAALIDKVNQLERVGSPKIVIVGDSNVAYGIDSEKIQEAFGLPVVNIGLHGGLGQAFHTDMVKQYIGNGDVIIIAPSSYEFSSTKINDCVLAWLTIENHWKLWSGIDYSNYLDMLKAYPTYLKRAINLWVANNGNQVYGDTSYKRSAFNKYGDNIYPRPISILKEIPTSSYWATTLSPEMEIYWNEFNIYVKDQNAKLYMSSPPILKETLTADLSSMQIELKEKLDFPVISELNDYVYPMSYFYDTGFHLTDQGKQIRTEQLIEDLHFMGLIIK